MKTLRFCPVLIASVFAAATPAVAQDRSEVDLARAALSAIQERSFRNDREYCGYLYFDSAGEAQVSKVKKGRRDSCEPVDPGPNTVIFASFHTHGAFDLDVPAEFPSSTDVEADEAEGIDGYVATPGGRFWFVDSEALVVSQICGIGCLPQDPDFVAGLDGVIEQSYSLDELIALENGE